LHKAIDIMAGGFFKLPGYSVFNYQPLYYDPDKEKREERRRQLRMEKGKDPDFDSEASTEERIRGRIKYRIAPVKKSRRNSNIRLFVIFSVLVILLYIILAV
jgi:hypothetical protein